MSVIIEEVSDFAGHPDLSQLHAKKAIGKIMNLFCLEQDKFDELNKSALSDDFKSDVLTPTTGAKTMKTYAIAMPLIMIFIPELIWVLLYGNFAYRYWVRINAHETQ